jgi:hypothetical protein
LIDWLNGLAAFRPDRAVPGVLIGLFGDEEERAGELDWAVSQFTRAAHQARMHFVWQWIGRDATLDFEWLADTLEERLDSNRATAVVSAQSNENLVPAA